MAVVRSITCSWMRADRSLDEPSG